MAIIFSCQCGETKMEGQHPFRCETCPSCGSQIISDDEPFDEPLEHSLVEREENGIKFTQCKRCGFKPA